MKTHFFRARPGTSLVELLLYLAVIAIVGVALLPLFFASTENRLLQQTASAVEQNGAQLLQNVSLYLKSSERILDPLPGATGAVLAVQTGSGAIDPIIIGISSGSLVLIRHATRQVLSSPQVAIDRFVVRNTSVSPLHQSVSLSFNVSRAIRLQLPRTYVRSFDAAFTLYPRDRRTGNACGCANPGCASLTRYAWQVCEAGACLSATAPLDCPR